MASGGLQFRPMAQVKIDLKLVMVKTGITFLVFAVVLFLAAGTVAWWAGWTFLALFFSFTVLLTLWLRRHDPGLLQERLTGLSFDEEPRDRVLFRLTGALFVAWLALMPLDAVRWHWSHVPGWLQVSGVCLLLCSFYLFFLTFRENSYLSPAIRIQRERGHRVVSTGPYRYVRHPMYSAFGLWFLGTALLLGSWCGILFGLLLMGLIARRAVLEERTLRAGLEGYDSYMARVGYRLIPRVW